MAVLKITWDEFCDAACRDLKKNHPNIDENSSQTYDIQGKPIKSGGYLGIAFVQFEIND